jgi:hypothetical protein
MNCDLRQSTFREAHMDGIDFSHETQSNACDFTCAILAHAHLRGKFNDCNFTEATLTEAQMYDVDFGGCNFLNADLRGASCCQCDFAGADLSQANLADVDFDWSSYDRDTKWPADFAKPEKDDLRFKGRGMDPLLLRQVKAKAQSGPINFETFVDHLLNSFDRDRLKKSLKMLKSEKFQLFSEVGETFVAGIVKSQTDPDLVYSCRLTSEGQFSCCTQNLFACGGLRGALCKHLLVLLIGLAKANELDPTKTFQWVIQSQAQKPLLDREVAGEILLRYKGSEAGDIDWRPTETMPEDYYAY